MPFEQFTRDMSPVAIRVSKPSVSISGQGRMTFSTALSKQMGGAAIKAFAFGFDKEARVVLIKGVEAVPKGKENFYFSAAYNEKSKSLAVSGGGFCQRNGYDYKTAGTQTFEPIKVDEKGHAVTFQLPKETPKHRPIVPRKARKAKATAAGAGPVAVAAKVAEPASDDMGELSELAPE